MNRIMKPMMIWTAKKRMTTITRTSLAALLLAALASVLFSPRFESPVQAQAPSSKFKISDDLQGIMGRDPNVWVPVIIQTVAEPANSLMSEFGRSGGAGH